MSPVWNLWVQNSRGSLNCRNSEKMWVYQGLRVLESLRTHGTLEAAGTVISTPTSDRLLELIELQEFWESLNIQLVLEFSSCWSLYSFKISKSS